MTELYSDIYTTQEEIFAPELQDPDSSDPAIKYGRRVIPEATISIYSSEIDLYIYEKTFDEEEIICRIDHDRNIYKTNNVESFRFKDCTFTFDDNYKNDICGFDIAITLNNGNVIEIVYYGTSIHCPILGGIPVHP